MSTTQIGNKAGNDVVGRDKYEGNTFYVSQPTSLSRLYEIFRDAEKSAPYTAQIAEQLRHYCALTTSADVRGLEEKLRNGDREYLIPDATILKEQAAKLIMRWQTSPVTQDIITHILAKIHTEFMFNVRPAIQSGAPSGTVDELIMDKVIRPTEQMLGDNDLSLTLADIAGLLFFLGGNCHIRWDKC